MSIDGIRLRKVCADCPFRSDNKFLGLTQQAVEEIAHSLEMGQPFHCHKTIDYNSMEKSGDGGDRKQLCAGALSTMERGGRRHQIVQIMERLGVDVSSHLDAEAQPVYSSLDEWAEHTGWRGSLEEE